MTMRNQINTWPMLSVFRDQWTPFSELFDHWVSLNVPNEELRPDRHFIPACSVDQSEDHYLLTIEIPGVKKEDIKIEFMDGQIVISGERKHSDERRSTGLHYTERSTGKFQRSFTLPVGIDAEKVEANYQDGILRVLLPKAASTKPRQIKITNGSSTSKFFGKLLSPKAKEDEHLSTESRHEKVAS